MEPVPSNWIGLTPGERAVYTYKASWTRTSSLAFETKQYDAGEHADKLNVYDGSRIATRFEIEHPDRTRLDNVMVPLYYQSTRYINFGDETAPRDFTLHIWEDEADLPGREIFSKSIVDPRPIAWLETTHFLKVDLSSDEVAPLSQFVHVGASNAGSDGNTILIAMTSHEADVSSHFSIGSWTDLWDVLSDYTYIAPFRITVAVGPDDLSP